LRPSDPKHRILDWPVGVIPAICRLLLRARDLAIA
jgi:hypothetical protein